LSITMPIFWIPVGRLGGTAHGLVPQLVGIAVHAAQELLARGQGLAVGLLAVLADWMSKANFCSYRSFPMRKERALPSAACCLSRAVRKSDPGQHRAAGIGDALGEDRLFLRAQDRFLGRLAQVGQHHHRARRLRDRQLGVLAGRIHDRACAAW
jgi:hypothetical protein